MFDLYSQQRTNFAPTMPRLASKAGQQRQTFPRSKNRGKKSDFVDTMNGTQQALLNLAKFKSSGVV